MKISEIIKTAATYLSREDVCEYLTNQEIEASRQTLETVDLLTRLTNLVISELSEGDVRMVEKVQLNGKTKITFAELDNKILDVVGVYDESGNQLEYSLSTYQLNSRNGIYTFVYSYLPANYGLFDTIGEFEKNVTTGILAYGVSAEFCLTEGRFEEAVMWNKRYVDSINKLYTPKNANIRGRNFV